MKVKELIAILQQADPETEVRASWESITSRIYSVYIGNEKSGEKGAVLLDSDYGFYQEQYAAQVLWEEE